METGIVEKTDVRKSKVSTGIKARMELAQEHMKAKRLDEAMEIFESILKGEPEVAAAYVGIGTIHFLKGNYDEAENYLNGALHLNDKYSQAMHMLANVSAKRGDLKLSLTQHGEALKFNPKMNMARLAVGRIHIQLEQYDEAEKTLKEALRYNPQYTEAALMLSQMLQIQGQTDKALANLDELIERTPDVWQAYIVKGKLLMRKGDYKSSVAVIQKSLKIKPDNPVAFLFLGQVYIADKQYDQAINVLKKAIALNPNMDIAKMQLSKAYTYMENYDEAKKILQELSMGENRLSLIHFRLADIFAKQGQYSLAVPEYEAAVLHADKIAENYPELLNIKQMNGDAENIVKAYQTVLNKIKLDFDQSRNPDKNIELNESMNSNKD